MKPIKKTRLMLLGLVAVHVVFYVCAWFVDWTMGNCVGAVVFLAIPTQSALLGLWIAMGRRWAIPWRACLGIAIVAAAGFGLNHFNPNAASHDYQLFVGEMCLAALGLLLARVAGLRLGHVAAPRAFHGPLQFSLLDVFGWMTATAIILSFIQCLPAGTTLRYLPTERTMGTALAILTLIGFASIWVVFGRRWLALRCVLCAMLVGLASPIQTSLGGWGVSWFLFVFSVYAAWLIASLLVIRWAGHRLEWQWRFSRGQNDASS
jgi:hypothetical protein